MRFPVKLIKPYLFIVLFLVVPLLLIPLLKSIKNNSAFYQENQVGEKNAGQSSEAEVNNYGLVLHGGAGNITINNLSSNEAIAYKQALFSALQIGMNSLESGDSAVLVVESVIRYLEDNPLFNAGKGAVFTHKGTNELDASIMDGKTLNAGAVAGVTNIKNPITAALKVMSHSPHVLLSGKGAERFAISMGLDTVSPAYFFTEKRWESLQKAKRKNNLDKHGTVGCVVLDKQGNLAAGTSTGGMTNKRYGRIGDSPIIGAGTYANNESCAISATGHGEYFIRFAVAHEISSRMIYLNEELGTASQFIIDKLKKQGADGGVIGIDTKGNITMTFNTTGMFRGYFLKNSEPSVYLFN